MKKGHEQVEKTLEMKKWSRNGKVIKQGRNVYDVLACIDAYSVFSRLPEALCGLMTKQTPFMHT